MNDNLYTLLSRVTKEDDLNYIKLSKFLKIVSDYDKEHNTDFMLNVMQTYKLLQSINSKPKN